MQFFLYNRDWFAHYLDHYIVWFLKEQRIGIWCFCDPWYSGYHCCTTYSKFSNSAWIVSEVCDSVACVTSYKSFLQNALLDHFFYHFRIITFTTNITSFRITWSNLKKLNLHRLNSNLCIRFFKTAMGFVFHFKFYSLHLMVRNFIIVSKTTVEPFTVYLSLTHPCL